jgi:uncharacterized phage infection (PIP) family protein YhgE
VLTFAEQHDEDLQAKMDALEDDLEAALARAELAEGSAERVTELENAAQSATTRAETAEAALTEEHDRLAKLTAELAHAHNRAANEAKATLDGSQGRNARTADLEHTIEQLRADLSEATRASTNGNDSHRAAVARLERDLAQIDGERQTIAEDLTKAEITVERLRGDNAQLSVELAALGRVELENARLRQDLLAATSASHQPCRTCSATQAEVEHVRGALRRAQAESADQSVAIAKLNKAKASLKEDREGLLIALEVRPRGPFSP